MLLGQQSKDQMKYTNEITLKSSVILILFFSLEHHHFAFPFFSISNCSFWSISTSSSVSSTILNPLNPLNLLRPIFQDYLDPLYNFGDLHGITNITPDVNTNLLANDAG